MVPSASASRIRYRSIYAPKISRVFFLSFASIGVPVNPMRAAFGKSVEKVLMQIACRGSDGLRQ